MLLEIRDLLPRGRDRRGRWQRRSARCAVPPARAAGFFVRRRARRLWSMRRRPRRPRRCTRGERAEQPSSVRWAPLRRFGVSRRRVRARRGVGGGSLDRVVSTVRRLQIRERLLDRLQVGIGRRSLGVGVGEGGGRITGELGSCAGEVALVVERDTVTDRVCGVRHSGPQLRHGALGVAERLDGVRGLDVEALGRGSFAALPSVQPPRLPLVADRWRVLVAVEDHCNDDDQGDGRKQRAAISTIRTTVLAPPRLAPRRTPRACRHRSHHSRRSRCSPVPPNPDQSGQSAGPIISTCVNGYGPDCVA